MSEDPAPERVAVIWSPEARADLRVIDRETAMQILYCLDRYLADRAGGVRDGAPAHRAAAAGIEFHAGFGEG
ncbi:MAG: hypothetical protein ACLQU1_24235 [Bryobacteraceae bacterium]